MEGSSEVYVPTGDQQVGPQSSLLPIPDLLWGDMPLPPLEDGGEFVGENANKPNNGEMLNDNRELQDLNNHLNPASAQDQRKRTSSSFFDLSKNRSRTEKVLSTSTRVVSRNDLFSSPPRDQDCMQEEARKLGYNWRELRLRRDKVRLLENKKSSNYKGRGGACHQEEQRNWRSTPGPGIDHVVPKMLTSVANRRTNSCAEPIQQFSSDKGGRENNTHPGISSIAKGGKMEEVAPSSSGFTPLTTSSTSASAAAEAGEDVDANYFSTTVVPACGARDAHTTPRTPRRPTREETGEDFLDSSVFDLMSSTSSSCKKMKDHNTLYHHDAPPLSRGSSSGGTNSLRSTSDCYVHPTNDVIVPLYKDMDNFDFAVDLQDEEVEVDHQPDEAVPMMFDLLSSPEGDKNLRREWSKNSAASSGSCSNPCYSSSKTSSAVVKEGSSSSSRNSGKYSCYNKIASGPAAPSTGEDFHHDLPETRRMCTSTSCSPELQFNNIPRVLVGDHNSSSAASSSSSSGCSSSSSSSSTSMHANIKGGRREWSKDGDQMNTTSVDVDMHSTKTRMLNNGASSCSSRKGSTGNTPAGFSSTLTPDEAHHLLTGDSDTEMLGDDPVHLGGTRGDDTTTTTITPASSWYDVARAASTTTSKSTSTASEYFYSKPWRPMSTGKRSGSYWDKDLQHCAAGGKMKSEQDNFYRRPRMFKSVSTIGTGSKNWNWRSKSDSYDQHLSHQQQQIGHYNNHESNQNSCVTWYYQQQEQEQRDLQLLQQQQMQSVLVNKGGHGKQDSSSCQKGGKKAMRKSSTSSLSMGERTPVVAQVLVLSTKRSCKWKPHLPLLLLRGNQKLQMAREITTVEDLQSSQDDN
ncbi:unnamed protein product [Amoebophrya sp. A120]|nr:unnamed protein product [Amoebophrya sp. A120]|eukprot:GSA120T00019333001.1